MDCIVRGVAKSWTQLSGFHFQKGKQRVSMQRNNFLCKYRLWAELRSHKIHMLVSLLPVPQDGIAFEDKVFSEIV